MVIINNDTYHLELTAKRDGTIEINRMNEEVHNLHLEENDYRNLMVLARRKNERLIIAYFNDKINRLANTEHLDDAQRKMLLKTAVENLLKFFTEFQFVPSYRFINTLARCADVLSARQYICNYFTLIDSPYSTEVLAKSNSPELTDIINKFLSYARTDNVVNSRLRIYYGAQGTGKTTVAQEETAYTIVCNASMQPCDLIEDFMFDDGKATFHPSVLVKCMEEGKTILLDEINLLPYDTLRFLQGLCDNKENLEWKGHTIHIAKGFSIIGTMNLVLNGTTYGLPEPLVDRCSELREFTLNADMLLEGLV